MNKSDDLKVFISSRDSRCEECKEDLGRSAWIFLAGERGPLCLACAELEHLPLLPSGNTALTRRAKKHSRRRAVVLKWSRARKRYERQGLLVEEEALARAEAECLADEEARKRSRQRSEERRKELDEQYVARFAEGIRELFHSCPMNREQAIAEFACLKYSRRVGRSAAAKQLDEDAIRLAWPLPNGETIAIFRIAHLTSHSRPSRMRHSTPHGSASPTARLEQYRESRARLPRSTIAAT